MQCILIGVWTVLYKRRSRAKQPNGDAAGPDCSEIIDSSLRDYDPYFAEDAGVHNRRRVLNPDCNFEFPAKEERRANRKRRLVLGDEATSGPSSLGSVGPRNLI